MTMPMDQVPKLSLSEVTVEESLTPSMLSGKKRPNTQTLAADLCNSQFLKMSCVGGDGKTPRSISITAAENRVLRMPDSGLMFKQQRSLQDMLTDIYEDPNGFEEFIQDIRSEMKPHTDVVPSPFDSRCGCLNDYTIDESIVVGRGRFSVVHFATRKRDMLPCALKKINCNPSETAVGGGVGEKENNPVSGNEGGVSPEKCLKEVGLLRSLDHPNIIKYLDSFLDESELYIILEWAGKGDLKELISEQRNGGFHFSELKVWTYFSQCAEAIRHMHDKRIIHRDIKPSNVFVMEDGSLKLGDLGLGRYLDLQSILAFSQVGTPLYMSPEVLRGEGHHFASDIWSLGCLLYELATLRSPFQEKGLTMDRLFLKIVKGDYSRQGYSSGRVSRVVESMLNTDPKQRPDIHWVADTSLLATKLLSSKSTTSAKQGSVSSSNHTSLPKSLPGAAMRKQERSDSQQHHLSSEAKPHSIPEEEMGDEQFMGEAHSPSNRGSELRSYQNNVSLEGQQEHSGSEQSSKSIKAEEDNYVKSVLDPILDPLLDEFSPPSRGPSLPRIEETEVMELGVKASVNHHRHQGTTAASKVSETPNVETTTMPLTQDSATKSSATLFHMYDEEEVSLMNELVDLEELKVDPVDPVSQTLTSTKEKVLKKKSPSLLHSKSVAVNAIYPADEDDDDELDDEEVDDDDVIGDEEKDMSSTLLQVEARITQRAPLPPSTREEEESIDLMSQSMSKLETKLQNFQMNQSFSSSGDVRHRERSGSKSAAAKLMSPSTSSKRMVMNMVSGLIKHKKSSKVHIEENSS